MDVQNIQIIRIRKPLRSDINEQLQWIGTSLGLFSLRDRDKSCFRIFIELLKSTKAKHGLTSDELAYRLKLSRGTVVHHLKKLKTSGLVIVKSRTYVLRNDNLDSLVDELKKDIDRTFGELRAVSKDVDRKLGI